MMVTTGEPDLETEEAVAIVETEEVETGEEEGDKRIFKQLFQNVQQVRCSEQTINNKLCYSQKDRSTERCRKAV